MDTSKAVADLVGGNMTIEQLQAQLAAMKAENDKLKAAQMGTGVITAKIGKRGGISVYGLQRQPITLYSGQWQRLLGYLKAGDANPIAVLIASNPVAKFDASTFKSDEDKKYLAEIRQGKHPHASVNQDGEVVVKLATKAVAE